MPGPLHGAPPRYIPPEHETRYLYCLSSLCKGEVSWVGTISGAVCWACDGTEDITWNKPNAYRGYG